MSQPAFNDASYDFTECDDDDQIDRLQNRWKNAIYRAAVKTAKARDLPILDITDRHVKSALSASLMSGATMKETHEKLMTIFERGCSA